MWEIEQIVIILGEGGEELFVDEAGNLLLRTSADPH